MNNMEGIRKQEAHDQPDLSQHLLDKFGKNGFANYPEVETSLGKMHVEVSDALGMETPSLTVKFESLGGDGTKGNFIYMCEREGDSLRITDVISMMYQVNKGMPTGGGEITDEDKLAIRRELEQKLLTTDPPPDTGLA